MLNRHLRTQHHTVMFTILGSGIVEAPEETIEDGRCINEDISLCNRN